MSIEIKRYSDFAAIEKRFDGDKLKINDIINQEIIVHDFKIKKSIQDPEKDYLTLHIWDCKPVAGYQILRDWLILIYPYGPE